MDEKGCLFDVEGMAFYVLCEVDAREAHAVGYFSREIAHEDDTTVNVVIVFPPYQRRGFGKMLIALSYQIAKRRRRPGRPELPMSEPTSDSGKRSAIGGRSAEKSGTSGQSPTCHRPSIQRCWFGCRHSMRRRRGTIFDGRRRVQDGTDVPNRHGGSNTLEKKMFVKFLFFLGRLM
jgi:hypothetical protein